jgi:phage-related protein
MSATATFQADFSRWNQALANAKDGLKSFEVPVKSVQAQLQRMATSLSGADIKRQAAIATAAIEKIGGVTKLTEQEQRKLNATVAEGIAKYKALGQEAPADLQKLHGELTKVIDDQKKLAESQKPIAAGADASGLSFTTLAGSVLTAQLAYRALSVAGREVVEFLSSSIDSYANAEAAQKKLVVALQAQGTATPQVIKQYNDLAATFQNTTIYSDDLINEMEALLTQIGSVMPQDMGKALTAATDLASGLGIDLQQATMLVGKTLEGNTGALGRYGVKLDAARVSAEGMDYVARQLAERFGGQAQAQLDTYAGRVLALANAWDNVKEAVGKVLVTSPLLEAGLRGIQEQVAQTGDGLGQADIKISDVVSGFSGLAGVVPGAGSGLAGFAAVAGPTIGILEGLAQAANDAYNIMAKLARDAPKLPTTVTLPKITGGLEEFDRQGKAAKDAATAAKVAEKAYQDWANAVTTVGAAIKAAQLEENFLRLNASGKLTAEALQAILKEAEPLREKLGTLPPVLELLRAEYQTVIPQTDTFAHSLTSLIQVLPTVARTIETAAANVRLFVQELLPSRPALDDLMVGAMAVPAPLKSMAIAGQEAGQAFSQMGREIRGSFEGIGRDISDSFAGMLTHATSFKDGFLGVWKSIQRGITDILSSILNDFIKRFLKGLLNAILGAQGGFSGAFSGLLSGLFSGGGGVGGMAGMAGIGGFGGIGAGAGAAGIGGNTVWGSGLPGASTGGIGVAGGALLGAGAGIIVGGLVGGRTGNRVAAGLSGAGAGAAVGSIGGPIGAGIGAIVGGVYGLYAAKQANKKANDIRDEYLAQFGGQGTGAGSGFGELAKMLQEATGSGKLFQDFIKANDPGEISEAIDAVTAALGPYIAQKQKAAEAEAAHAQAVADATAKFEEQKAVLSDQLKSLDTELAALNASEAPEAVMGVIEAQTRARIASEKQALDEQMANLEKSQAETLNALDETAKAAAKSIQDALDALRAPDLTIRIHYELPNPDQMPGGPGGPEGPPSENRRPPGYASGTPGLGFVDFGRESLVRLHGREAVIPESRVAALRDPNRLTGEASRPFQSITIMQIDKREIGRAVADVLPGELRRLGVRVRA